MKTRKLGARGPIVGAVGLGCMGMSFGRGPTDESEAVATIHRAMDLGCNFLDTADAYGGGHNEQLIAKAIKGRRDTVVLATKCGIVADPKVPAIQSLNGTPAYIKACVVDSLQRLAVEAIDLYYLHRFDSKVPVEESMGAFADILKAGKIRHVGLSGVSVDQIERAMKVVPVTAVQNEYSLFNRDSDGPVFDTCRRLGIAWVPYSPLGRGFLTGTLASSNFDPNDTRVNMKPYQGENFDKNKALMARFTAIADRKGITGAQLALAWVLAQGEYVVPIPGTQRRKYLEDNLKAADVMLSAAELKEIQALDLARTVAGRT